MGVQGGFHQRVAFMTKNGTQTFDEIGDGIETVVVTKDNKYRKAVVHKLGEKKKVYKVTFRRSVYANTDTIIYAAEDQEWVLAAREEKKVTSELEVGDKLWRLPGSASPPWEVVDIEEIEEEQDVWSVEISGEDSFVLRNEIPTASMEDVDERND